MIPTTVDGRVVSAVAVHDDAMLSRIVSVLGVHPVGSFSYTRAGDRALVRLEIVGDAWHQTRVLHKVRRIIGVLEAGFDGDGDVRRGTSPTPLGGPK